MNVAHLWPPSRNWLGLGCHFSFRFTNIDNSPCQLSNTGLQTTKPEVKGCLCLQNKEINMYLVSSSKDLGNYFERKWFWLLSQTGKWPLYNCMGKPTLAALCPCTLPMSPITWLHSCHISVTFCIWSECTGSGLKINTNNILIFHSSELLNTSHCYPYDVF